MPTPSTATLLTRDAPRWPERAGRWLLAHASVFLFLAGWELLPRAGGLLRTFIAPPSVVARVLWDILRSGELAQHAGVSAFRALSGFGLAAVLALPLGFLLGGRFHAFERVVSPVLSFLGQVNPFSLFPLFMLLFGIGELSKSALVFWVCLWPLLFHTTTAVKQLDPLLVRAGRTLGCGPLRLFFRVIVPAASPGIFAGLRASASTAFFMLVAAEMIGATSGLGWLVWNSEINFQIARLFTATVVISVLGLGLNALLGVLERRLVGWKGAWSA
jgi:NitT/TauT family transport system permease protein